MRLLIMLRWNKMHNMRTTNHDMFLMKSVSEMASGTLPIKLLCMPNHFDQFADIAQT